MTSWDHTALLVGLLCLWLSGCATPSWDITYRDEEPAPQAVTVPPPATGEEVTPREFPAEASQPRGVQIYPGTGAFINPRAISPQLPHKGEPAEATLNFEQADIREVVRLILGETLKENYFIDPNVQGSISLRTAEPLDRSALLSILEVILQVNDAALVEQGGFYRVVPLADALRGSTPGLGTATGPPGYQASVITLRYIAAQEMAQIIEPFFPAEGVIRVDSRRNLLVVAGNAFELAQIGELVELFDVNWLQGMSVGLLPIRYANVNTIADEIKALLVEQDEDLALSNLIRFVPIEHLNALMVITPQSHYLEYVRTWIARLDIPGEGTGRRLYVYRVQNSRAEDLAALLRELFQVQGPEVIEELGLAELAPGAVPRVVQTSPGETRSDIEQAVEAVGVFERRPAVEQGPAPLSGVVPPELEDVGAVSEVGIIADRSTNSLVILATPDDYAKIEGAIRQLDIMPLQVLLEATIVEVLLSGELSYGVQWFFTHSLPDDHSGLGTVGLPLSFPGSFSYSIVNSADEIRALLNLLATEDKVKVISAPSVLVLDNETANIRVGNQQPVSTSVITESGVVATSVQFKDTGVTLNVTPRVNASGLVTLDVSQQLTDVGAIDDATGQRAFLERSIESSVALHSGESVVLGGLIQENSTKSRSGVPFLYKLPIIGALFGQRINTVDRVELLVLLNVSVVKDRNDMGELLGEFRRKMGNLFPLPPELRLDRGMLRPATKAPAKHEQSPHSRPDGAIEAPQSGGGRDSQDVGSAPRSSEYASAKEDPAKDGHEVTQEIYWFGQTSAIRGNSDKRTRARLVMPQLQGAQGTPRNRSDREIEAPQSGSGRASQGQATAPQRLAYTSGKTERSDRSVYEVTPEIYWFGYTSGKTESATPSLVKPKPLGALGDLAGGDSLRPN